MAGRPWFSALDPVRGTEHLDAGYRSEQVDRQSESTGRASLAGVGDMAGGAKTGQGAGYGTGRKAQVLGHLTSAGRRDKASRGVGPGVKGDVFEHDPIDGS